MSAPTIDRTKAWYGRRVRRNEDPRLLTGQGLFLDDVHLADMVHAAVLRSPYAHARIKAVDTAAARAAEGVLAVYTYADLPPECAGELPLLIPHPAFKHPRTQFALAKDEVNYVGEAVALVVARDRYLAEDALDHIEVAYEPLPAVADMKTALGEGAALVHHDLGTNLCGHYSQQVGDIDQALAAADKVIKMKLTIDRGSASPLEGRGIVAHWDRNTDSLTCWTSTQAPIPLRNGLAKMFGLHEQRVRVIAPDIGGAFGQKVVIFYPEEVLIPLAARRLGRPVKWIEDRRENFIGSVHERVQVHHAALGVKNDGTITGLKDVFLHEEGAYTPYGPIVPIVASTTLPGPYRLPAYYTEFRTVFTNKQPVSPYRGAGRPHGVYVMERLLDRAADELGLDRAEVRRRNLIQPDEFPYEVGLVYQDMAPVRYDSGNYPQVMQLVLDALQYDRWRREDQPRLRAQGRMVGIGLALYVEGGGIGPYEGAKVQIGATGKVMVGTGVGTQGQGHFTVFAQIAADALGVNVSDVEVVTGDTAAFPWGTGTFASRAGVVAGNAVHRAATAVREKTLQVAAAQFGVSPAALDLADGHAYVKANPDQRLPLGRLAELAAPVRFAVAEDFEPGLEATRYYNPPQGTFAAGAHGLILEIDPETSALQVHRYVVVHDCGTVINPLVLDGQVLGGLAQGIGNSYYEKLVYDEGAQLLTTTYMDYLLPTAAEVPDCEIIHHETPSPLNPLGAKGAGEGGVIPVPAAFAAAVEDALRPLGVQVTEMPLSHDRLWALIAAARSAGLSADDAG